jgi:aminoglycoside 6'-N-acetyltransferase I
LANPSVWPTIRLAQAVDADELVAMRVLLWPESSPEEQQREIEVWLIRGGAGTLPAVILVAEDEAGGLSGFVEVGLRSHADGCDTAQPVGYVEGWFVRDGQRGRGIGAKLMRAAEQWSREHGCLEMASDALIENQASQDAHRALGFGEVDRCVHFRKPLRR